MKKQHTKKLEKNFKIRVPITKTTLNMVIYSTKHFTGREKTVILKKELSCQKPEQQ